MRPLFFGADFFQNAFAALLWIKNWLKLLKLLSRSLKEESKSIFEADSFHRSVLRKICAKKKRSHVYQTKGAIMTWEQKQSVLLESNIFRQEISQKCQSKLKNEA